MVLAFRRSNNYSCSSVDTDVQYEGIDIHIEFNIIHSGFIDLLEVRDTKDDNSFSEIIFFIKYVDKWRAKSFCSGPQIKADLKLACSPRTIQRVLNRRGLRWTPVSRKLPLKKGQREARREWAERHADKGPQWWQDNVGLILDGVTLSLPPTGLTEKQRHAAQAITHTWLRKGERQDSDLATRNIYGGQLGEKVPPWGGAASQATANSPCGGGRPAPRCRGRTGFGASRA